MEEKLLSFFKRHWLPATLGALALIFFAYGMISLLATTSAPEVSFETDVQASNVDIAVDVEGSVRKPGLHRIKQGSLVQDALIAAGGLSEEADRVWIAKNLNLASKVSDAQKLYIPAEGEVETSSTSFAQGTSSVLIDINSATVSELDTLPGVGLVTANKIIDNRPYSSTNELLEKKVVGQATFEKIQDQITAQ